MPRPPLLYGLPPIADPDARLLILGNMPSAMSLAAGQYYGNPRNAFWRLTISISVLTLPVRLAKASSAYWRALR